MNKLHTLLFCLNIFLCFSLRTKEENKDLPNQPQAKSISISISNQTMQELEEKIKNLETAINQLTEQKNTEPEAVLDIKPTVEITETSNNIQENCKETIDVESKEIFSEDDDHRLTLRIPKSLMAKIDIKRKQRIGKISRNLWILETLERATKR